MWERTVVGRRSVEARRYSRRPHVHGVLIVTGTHICVRNNNNKYSVALVHFRLDVVRCCLPGDQKLVAKGGCAACPVWCNRRRRGYSFFRSRAGRRCRRTNRFGRVLPGGAHRRRRSPPRPYYIDHVALSSTAVPLSPRGPPAPPRSVAESRTPQQPTTTLSSGRRHHPPRVVHQRTLSLGGCQF